MAKSMSSFFKCSLCSKQNVAKKVSDENSFPINRDFLN